MPFSASEMCSVSAVHCVCVQVKPLVIQRFARAQASYVLTSQGVPGNVVVDTRETLK